MCACSDDGCGLTILPHPPQRHNFIYIQYLGIEAVIVPMPTQTLIPTSATPNLTQSLLHSPDLYIWLIFINLTHVYKSKPCLYI